MKNIFLTLIVLFLVASAVGGYFYYEYMYSENVKKDATVLIPTGSSYKRVLKILKPHLKDIKSFDRVAKLKKYDRLVKAGMYKIKADQNNDELINKLRSGNQDYYHLRIKNYDDIFQMTQDIGKQIEPDSTRLLKYLKAVAKSKRLSNVEELKIYFHPDTYYVNWNTSPKEFFTMFEKIHKKFWNDEREEKAEKLRLTPTQVMVLASIVQREYVTKDELPKIASLYLNRFNKGMKLQSDPTVIYAIKQRYGFDTQIKRVLKKDLSIESQYNTYLNVGLPPLPICMPSDIVIDAILSPEKTNYIYMCAAPNGKGHLFTDNYAEHAINAKKYQEWLNSIDIKR